MSLRPKPSVPSVTNGASIQGRTRSGRAFIQSVAATTGPPSAPRTVATYGTFGTDGFGRSDTRANLRRFFEVDRYYIAHAAVAALAAEGKMNAKDVARAIKQYKIDVERGNPQAL